MSECNMWEIEKEFYDSINKEYVEFPSHRYFFNILIDMGIYPNVESLNIGHEREYESIEDAMARAELSSFCKSFHTFRHSSM